jgi:hypothetical protein
MVDLCSELTPGLLSHRLPGLDLGEGFVYPQYSGQSIFNIPATSLSIYSEPPHWLEKPPFRADSRSPSHGNGRR